MIARMAARGWLRMDSQRVQRTEALFSRWGVYLVMFGRILPGVRTLASVPAGLSRNYLPGIPFLSLYYTR